MVHAKVQLQVLKDLLKKFLHSGILMGKVHLELSCHLVQEQRHCVCNVNLISYEDEIVIILMLLQFLVSVRYTISKFIVRNSLYT